MNIYKITMLLLLALVFGACSSTQTSNTATADQPTSDAKTNNESQPSNQTAASGSPTEVLKMFAEATKKKDVETIKKTLSKGTMAMVEESAKKQNISVDEMLTKVDNSEVKALPEIRNEKIDGDNATVEVKNEATNDYDVMPFVKEDGSWKIALDKFMESMMEKIKEASKAPAKPDADSKEKSDK